MAGEIATYTVSLVTGEAERVLHVAGSAHIVTMNTNLQHFKGMRPKTQITNKWNSNKIMAQRMQAERWVI